MNEALRVWRMLSSRRRRQFAWLSALSALAGLSEAIAIGSILPFLVVLSDPGRLFQHPVGQAITRWLGLDVPEQLLLPVSAAFCVAVLLACGVRLLVLWAGSRLSFAAGSDLADEIFRRTLHQPYSTHLRRSSADVIDLLDGGVNTVVFEMLIPAITIVTSVVVIVAITATMIVIDPVVAFCAFAGIGLIYGVVALASQHRLAVLGQREATNNRSRLMAIQESLGGMRDVLLHGSQDAYCDAFGKANRRSRMSTADKRFIAQSPRYVVEALAMTLVAVLAYLLTQRTGGLERSIPVLGAFALGAQRMLPAAQNIYAGWSTLKSAGTYLGKVAAYFDATEPTPHGSARSVDPLPFEREIAFRSVSFRYDPSAPWALDGVDVVIPAGCRLGIIGTSGSGKSTLVDLLMGLLDPAAGSLCVDGRAIDATTRRAWQENISHVPQSVFLADVSIAENIAFGVPKDRVDRDRVREAARKAQIADYIERQPEGYDTLVGERGVRLSGGQRQRLGIARALYRRAKVLIFDEATSALDSETELAVMEAIEGLGDDLTIVLIAHRLSTLRGCTRIVEIERGRVMRMGGFAELVGHA